MSAITLELTKRQAKIVDEVLEKVDETAIFLASLSYQERLDWLKEHQYPYPISFEREIGGTVYTVNAHFSDRATESPEQKIFRILTEI